MVRRSLIIANLTNISETVKEAIKNTVIDKFLFGNELMEKVKAAKQLEQPAESVSGKPKQNQKAAPKNWRDPLRAHPSQYQISQSGQRHQSGASGRNCSRGTYNYRRRSPPKNYPSKRTYHHSKRR